MGRSLEVIDGRIVSRRVGSVDWQDAMESFGMYSALVEDTGAGALLMDMAEADIQIPVGDARDLASMFVRSTPNTLKMAVIKPVNESGSRFIEAFVDMLESHSRPIAIVESESAAESFFAVPADRKAKGGGFLAGLVNRLRAKPDNKA